MAPTVYLHIGHGRCGSTSIQKFGEANRAALPARGISYPSATEMGYPAKLDRGGNAQAMYELKTEGTVAVDALRTHLEAHPDSDVLLSSEYLYSSPRTFLRNLVGACDSVGVRVVAIAYMREQREWLISRYAQAIKSKGWTRTLADYVSDVYRSPTLDYGPRFEELADVFGRENLIVRVFEPGKLRGGDARTDLYQLAGVDVSDLIRDDPVANASASVEELETLRLLNEVVGWRSYHPRAVLRRWSELFDQMGWEPITDVYRLAPPDLLLELDDYYQPLNEAFRREFFPDQPSPLFSPRIPDEYAPLREDELFSQRTFQLLADYFLGPSGREIGRRGRAAPPTPIVEQPTVEDPPAEPARAAICAIAKNEGPYLREWATYHRLIGFDPILVYDHESDDESPEVLAQLEGGGLVEAIPWTAPPDKKPQWLAYEHGLERLRDRADWIAFIDLDEFIVLPKHETIQAFLDEYGHLDAIGMNWKMFGTSGHLKREPGLVIERFTRCSTRRYDGNRAVKTLARPSAIIEPRVHTCVFRDGVGYQTVTGEDASDGATRTVSHDVIRINHYFTRSREEWDAKARKGRGAKPANHPKKHRGERSFLRSNRNEEKDTDILRYVPKVKKLMAREDRQAAAVGASTAL